MLRKTIFWFHLCTAVLVGGVVLIMASTGVLLTYQKQMQSWADLRGLNGAPPTPDARPLPLAELMDNVQNARKGTPSAIRWRADRNAPVEIVFGQTGSVFANAYTGEVLGTGADWLRSLFRKVGGLHGWLALSGDAQKVGSTITHAANLGLLFLIFSGFFLWWPRNWNRAAFRNVLMFRRGLRSKARDFNWHNVIGFWSLIPLFIVVSTAVVISYPWAGDMVYRAVGETPPTAPAAGRGGRGAKNDRIQATALPNIDAMVARAQQVTPDWQLLTMQVVSRSDEVAFSIDGGLGGQPQKHVDLVLSAQTGGVVKSEPFEAMSTGMRLRRIIRFAHTGEVAGIAGQTIAGLVSAGALFLVYTGIALALRRLFAWRSRDTEPGGATRGARPTASRKGGKAAIEA